MKKLLILSLLTISAQLFAYTVTFDSAKITNEELRLGINSVYFSDLDGMEGVLQADYAFSESLQASVALGTGKIDFAGSARLKWTPFPDVDLQPAIGVIFGIDLQSQNSTDSNLLRVQPIVSKKFVWEYGYVSPYASVLTGLAYVESDSEFVMQLVMGTELDLNSIDDFSFILEAGFEIEDVSNYISLGAKYTF